MAEDVNRIGVGNSNYSSVNEEVIITTELVWTFDSTEITFDSEIRTFDEDI